VTFGPRRPCQTSGMGVWVVFLNRQRQYFAEGVDYQGEHEDSRWDSTDDDVDTIHVVDTWGNQIASFPEEIVWEVEIEGESGPGA
jgi:hypothetical protein